MQLVGDLLLLDDEFKEGNFVFKKEHRYNKGGFRYLKFCFDGIEVCKLTLENIHPWLDAAVEQINKDHEDPELLEDGAIMMTPHTDNEVFEVANIKLHHLAIESFLRVGTEVEIASGEQQGMIGHVVSISTDGTVMVEEKMDSLEGGSRTKVEINAHVVRPVF